MRRAKRDSGLVIQPTRDFARVRAMLGEVGMITEGLEWPAACYLIASYRGDTIGVVGIETMTDAGAIRSLLVVPSVRRKGVGTALFNAARKAAHTRGVRQLYAFVGGTRGFFQSLGFQPVPTQELLSVLAGTPAVEYCLRHPDVLGSKIALKLDISQDGVARR